MIDVAVIGAGPAGIAVAIQLKIYSINFILFEQNEIGGLLRNANLVENYPGFPDGISGVALIKLIEQQLDRLGVSTIRTRVNSVNFHTEGFEIATDSARFVSRYVVLATGTVPKKFGIKNFNPDNCPQVLTEIHTLFGRENLQISVIGAGDAAFDYALNLSKLNQVNIHNRSHRLKCLPNLREKVLADSNITYTENSEVNSVIMQNEHLNIVWDNNGVEYFEYADYLVLAIGREPDIDCLSDNVCNNLTKLAERGKLFMVGDVTNGINRQIGISIGNGIAAAMELNKKIKE